MTRAIVLRSSAGGISADFPGRRASVPNTPAPTDTAPVRKHRLAIGRDSYKRIETSFDYLKLSMTEQAMMPRRCNCKIGSGAPARQADACPTFATCLNRCAGADLRRADGSFRRRRPGNASSAQDFRDQVSVHVRQTHVATVEAIG